MSEGRGRVVVITGASSGVGRAAALAFTNAGYRVVLAARRGEALNETAQACRTRGGQALVLVTDVTVDADIKRLIAKTREQWGTIDVWVNNAGVTLFATLDGAPFEEHRRVIETNLLGAMQCAYAVVPVFKEQGFGTLINVGSVLSEIGQPFVPSYAISKFALRGLSQSLSAELADEPHIHICSLFPYTIDTPHFQSGANEMGHPARALPPIQSPERVADALVSLARRPRRELYVPKIAVLGLALHRIFPSTTERLLVRVLRRWHFEDATQPHSQGNLYASPPDASTHGERRPLLSTPHLLGWSARELVRMQFQDRSRRRRERRASRHAD
jgi:NAD(P)-dependent dehydrogenase (short-subunit alcohol dehydrogenase family)